MGLYRTAYENSLKDKETDEPLYRLLSSALKLHMRGFSMVRDELEQQQGTHSFMFYYWRSVMKRRSQSD